MQGNSCLTMVEGIDMYACLNLFELGSTPMLQHRVLLSRGDHLACRALVSVFWHLCVLMDKGDAGIWPYDFNNHTVD